MATGAAIAGIGIGLAGMGQARKAARSAQEARDLQAKQLQQQTEEEIRRKEYTHGRDISSIEAEIAASGISATGVGLRAIEKRTTTTVDSEFNSLTSEKAEIQTQLDEDRESFERLDVEEDYRPNTELTKRLEENAEQLKQVEYQRSKELEIPWNEYGGIFSEYLSERERVHISEVSWMKATGLSSVKSALIEGDAAIQAARAAGTRATGQVIQSAANWWQASQPPATTTTTQQTATV